MDSRNMILDHEFYCTCCGKKGIPICRDGRKIKEKGHLKKIYCINCQREVNHVEVVEQSKYNKAVFIDEFKSGNFDKSGNRVIPLKEWKYLYYGTEQWIDEKELVQETDDINEWLELFQSGNKEIA